MLFSYQFLKYLNNKRNYSIPNKIVPKYFSLFSNVDAHNSVPSHTPFAYGFGEFLGQHQFQW
ncbi:Uncharacterised protein [Streptococcus pneumoniae]|nr:Uncharacterised protein [Streptococcus pneumoniae]